MQTTEKLKLHEKLAAVKCSTGAVTDEIAGVAEIIPAGETIRMNVIEPLVGKMRQIEWKGERYGVFPEDLKERAEAPAHRTKIAEEN